MGGHEGDRTKFFTTVHGRRLTDNGCKLKEEKLTPDTRKNLPCKDSQVLG